MKPYVTFIPGKNCPECGNDGATQNTGLCLCCTVKAMERTPMKSATGRAAQSRWRLLERKHKATT